MTETETKTETEWVKRKPNRVLICGIPKTFKEIDGFAVARIKGRMMVSSPDTTSAICCDNCGVQTLVKRGADIEYCYFPDFWIASAHGNLADRCMCVGRNVGHYRCSPSFMGGTWFTINTIAKHVRVVLPTGTGYEKYDFKFYYETFTENGYSISFGQIL